MGKTNMDYLEILQSPFITLQKLLAFLGVPSAEGKAETAPRTEKRVPLPSILTLWVHCEVRHGCDELDLEKP